MAREPRRNHLTEDTMRKLLLVSLFVGIVGCVDEPLPTPDGYERTTTGSGCRAISSGRYVDPSFCEFAKGE